MENQGLIVHPEETSKEEMESNSFISVSVDEEEQSETELKPNMGEQKVQMEYIQDKEKRRAMISKKRKSLFKEAAEICVECDAKIAIVTFDNDSGEVHAFGHDSVDSVLDRYLNGVQEEEENKKKKPDDYQISVGGEGTSSKFWWEDINVNELSFQEIQKLRNRLLDTKRNVRMRIEELVASSSSSSAAAEAIVDSTADPAAALPIGFRPALPSQSEDASV